MKDQIGRRMKHNYEDAYKVRLPLRLPVIIRIDGKSFHSFTKKINLETPFDYDFWTRIHDTGIHVAKQISGSIAVYSQSDEISILVHTYKKLDTNPYAGNELQKLVSHSAAMASVYFSQFYDGMPIFDSRAFVLPEAEVNNYFIWRQKDCQRNAVSSAAQAEFSHRQLHGKNSRDKMHMLSEIEKDFIAPHFMDGMFSMKPDGGEWLSVLPSHNFMEMPEIMEKLLKTIES